MFYATISSVARGLTARDRAATGFGLEVLHDGHRARHGVLFRLAGNVCMITRRRGYDLPIPVVQRLVEWSGGAIRVRPMASFVSALSSIVANRLSMFLHWIQDTSGPLDTPAALQFASSGVQHPNQTARHFGQSLDQPRVAFSAATALASV